jgi:hypothetical protein
MAEFKKASDTRNFKKRVIGEGETVHMITIENVEAEITRENHWEELMQPEKYRIL